MRKGTHCSMEERKQKGVVGICGNSKCEWFGNRFVKEI